IGAPPPDAPYYVLDAGAGEGTVISTFLTALHKKIPRAPVAVAAKEISIDDICILLGYLPDRFAEHKLLAFHITNLSYREMAAPEKAKFLHVKKELRGDTSHDFGLQLMNMAGFVKKHWALEAAEAGGVLRPRRKIVLSIYRKDQKTALAKILPPHAPPLPREFDFVIASHPMRLRRPPAETAALVVAPLLQMVRAGGKMILSYASGRDFSRALLRFLYPKTTPYQYAAPGFLLRALTKIPSCAAVARAARVSSFRYGFINLYLGRKNFSLGNILSLWKAVAYVGQISETEQRAAGGLDLPRRMREKLAAVKDMSFANYAVHFRKPRARKKRA
ncbi:MAG: hypothetical protein ACR2P5_04545, partial [Gammaproteobacteria bacterium]